MHGKLKFYFLRFARDPLRGLAWSRFVRDLSAAGRGRCAKTADVLFSTCWRATLSAEFVRFARDPRVSMFLV